jgi:hypothetical protein
MRERKTKPVIICEVVEGDYVPVAGLPVSSSVDAAIKYAAGLGEDLAGKRLVVLKVCEEFELKANPAYKVVKG